MIDARDELREMQSPTNSQRWFVRRRGGVFFVRESACKCAHAFGSERNIVVRYDVSAA